MISYKKKLKNCISNDFLLKNSYIKLVYQKSTTSILYMVSGGGGGIPHMVSGGVSDI